MLRWSDEQLAAYRATRKEAASAAPVAPPARAKYGNKKVEIDGKKFDSKAEGARRDRGEDELWGFCKGCYYASVCKGGCSWTAHTLLGRRGKSWSCGSSHQGSCQGDH